MLGLRVKTEEISTKESIAYRCSLQIAGMAAYRVGCVELQKWIWNVFDSLKGRCVGANVNTVVAVR